MIHVQNDLDIDLATANTRISKKWKNRTWKWSELVNKCAETKRTSETAAEYRRMAKDEQSRIKDVGGFVGGYLSGGTRKTKNVIYRSILTLDIDFGNSNVWDDFTMMYDFAALLYSTHKHTSEKPRYRLVIPLNRQVTPAEYEPICRKIASELGMDLFDDTTYELPRLFYWPSTSKGAPYEFHFQDGKPCNADEILGEYHDYHDVSEWPISSRENDVIVHEMKKVGDPDEKPGLIGAFCRAYSIEDAIEEFLPDVYEKTAIEGRYTYIKGSVAGGLVCYSGKFAYSYHNTDPSSRQLCNAFDLVRIHKFGIKDEDSIIKDIVKKPSYLAMQDFAANDKKVRLMLAQERHASIDEDFAQIEAKENEANPTPSANKSWLADLDCDRKGSIKPTAKNIISILENDPKLKDRIFHDLFSGFDLVKGLPWNPQATQWGNKDDANLRIYMEELYGITAKDKIKDAKDAVLTRHEIHPIKEYLNGLKWDGTERLDTLIIDYLGAPDTPLVRAMTRKHFTAAVARVMNPGCKYDYCLIMQGAEGLGKSTLLNVMGGDWFSDSLTTTEGKNGMESLRCGWIIELAELASIKRSDVEQIKNYISRRDDIYRAAYGSVVERHPRQCVFCGTTNEDYFLKGDTGNRRFWIVPVGKTGKRQTMDLLKSNRDQLWAEAVQRYKDGELLYLPDDLEQEARQKQIEYNDGNDDPLPDMLNQFLDMLLPPDWSTWDVRRRRAYLADPDPLDEAGTEQRTKVCTAEFICEKLGRDPTDKDYKYLARRVTKLLNDLPNWERISSTRHVENLYGIQRGFRRKMEAKNDGDEDL